MRAHQKNPGQQDAHVLKNKSHEHQRHDRDLEDFHGDGDGALAETVGEKTARHGKQNERQREQRAHELAGAMLLRERQARAEDHEHHEVFQDIVAERALKLRHEQGPEVVHSVWRLASGIRGSLVVVHGGKANRSRAKE